MDRRTLFAIVLIMAILLVDQVIWSRYTRSRQPPHPAGTGAPAVPGDSAAMRAAMGESALAGRPIAEPGEATSSAARFTGTVTTEAGEALVRARVPGAPATTDSLATDRYRATFTSRGGAVSSWVLPHYKDSRREAPVDLVPRGQTAMHVAVGTTGVAYDFTDATFRKSGGSSREGWLSFTAQESSGVRVTKTYRLARDPNLLDIEVRVSAPASLGPIRYRIGWANPLPLTESNAHPNERTAVAYLGARLEIEDPPKILKDGTKRLSTSSRP